MIISQGTAYSIIIGILIALEITLYYIHYVLLEIRNELKDKLTKG